MPWVMLLVFNNTANLNLNSVETEDIEAVVDCFGVDKNMNDTTVLKVNHKNARLSVGLVSNLLE